MDRAPLDRFTASQQLLVKKAQSRLAATAKAYADKSPEVLQIILARQYGKLVTEYGDAVAAAAARMYEELRPNKLGVFKAEVAAQYSDKELARRFREAAKGKSQAQLEAGLQKDIMDMGRETIAHNMKRDKSKVKWARVPKGKTCAWCTMLASRGWVYASEKSAGGRGREYHAHCDCMVVPSWDKGKPKLKGYDPDKLRDMYELSVEKAGSGASSKDVLRAMRAGYSKSLTDGLVPEELKKKPGPKAVPKWLNARNLDKVIDGVVVVGSSGEAILKGGHAFGKGWVGKTEFPRAWGASTIRQAIKDTWLTPDAERITGDRRRVRKIVDGVLVEVSAYGAGYSEFRAAFPVGGVGVFENTIDGKVVREIENSWEELWA